MDKDQWVVVANDTLYLPSRHRTLPNLATVTPMANYPTKLRIFKNNASRYWQVNGVAMPEECLTGWVSVRRILSELVLRLTGRLKICRLGPHPGQHSRGTFSHAAQYRNVLF